MRLKKITIKGFRGFREEQPIHLDRPIVVIYGLNGSGKSSFTEAIEWLFFNEISRQRLSRCRSEYQHEEYLRNLFYDGDANPFVEIEGSIQGTPVTVRKELEKRGSRSLINGEIVDDFSSLDLNLESYFRPMLAQTEIKALVDTEQKDRWEQLSSILGQDDLTRLREHLLSLRNTKRDQTFKQKESRFNAIIEELSEWDNLSDLHSAASSYNVPRILSALHPLAGIELSDFRQALRTIQQRQVNLIGTELGEKIAGLSYDDTDELEKKLVSLQADLESLQKQFEKAASGGHDHLYMEFLEKGKDFIKGNVCPYCRERTLSKERIDTIESTLTEATQSRAAKGEADRLIRSTTSTAEHLARECSRYLPDASTLKLISQKLSDMSHTEVAAKIQSVVNSIDEVGSSFNENLPKCVADYHSYLENVYFHEGSEDPDKLKKPQHFMSESADKIQGIVNTWIEIKGKLAQVVPASTTEQQQEVKKWLLIERLVEFFRTSEAFVAKIEAMDVIDRLQTKLEDFERSEVKRLLEEHAGEIGEYYSRLNQGETVQFSGIDVKGGARRQAKLKAEAYGKTVNPVTFFSEAHTNSLALSIYFPQRVDRNETWETVILDDPVQSMDENHSQALIEILADLSERKQVIVLTHSKSFFKRMCSSVRHKKPLIYQFYDNDDHGPKINVDEAETITHLNSVSDFAKKGDAISLETAGQSLRKAIESVLFEHLLEKGVSFTKAQRLQKRGISHLFSECESNGLPPAETSKLKGLLDTGDSNSHAWCITDTTKGGLSTGQGIVRSIYQRFVE